ncbi:MAG: DNA methyltransferase [Anaerolineae bacterium]|nr:DNA methyltransferase [Anaerolineae bacterium]
MPIKSYLNQLRQSLATGASTEHTHRPALATLLEALAPGHIKAINEPTRIACGAPDFAVLKDGFLVGHIEAKDIGVDLNAVERSPQLKRYLDALPNLILTDYVEFRWYVNGERRETARLATYDRRNQLKSTANDVQAVGDLLEHFLAHTPQPIATPRELAERLAHLAHLIRDIIVAAFETENASNLLQGWRTAFAQVLVADLDQPEKISEFADMFAQTLAYGLFSARVMDDSPQTFTRAEAQRLIPRTNPFLRDFFYQITGPQLEDEPFAGFVEDLVQLLALADIGAILADFGKRTRQEDPTVHFYETFLAAYDPRLRESRGVFYTPDPVVSFIVRSVDQLLKTRFGLPQGLADTSKVTVKNTDPGLRVKGKESQVRKTVEVHKVLILDPATGTGTFPYAVVDHIRAQFMRQGNAGMWSGYVREHLLPRIFGFELLMAPYAVAHFKLAMQLAGYDLDPELRAAWAYDFRTDERIGIYLTNALEGPHEHTGLPLFTQFLANESAAANEIKQDLPIMVIVGNPPYSNFGMLNKNEWIRHLLEDYKRGLNEKKINLDDDSIKFIRFGQWRIEQSGSGILAFITNNSFIDGLTHRRMRQSLLETFSEIYILNLHGSIKKREKTPDGAKDENVFDIQQGVSINLFVRSSNKTALARVYYAELWGTRESKYGVLSQADVETLEWKEVELHEETFFFVQKDFGVQQEYENYFPVLSVFTTSSSGIQTKRDSVAIAKTRSEILATIADFSNMESEVLREKYKLPPDGRDWTINWAASHAKDIIKSNNGISLLLYRPFDSRWTIIDNRSKGFVAYPRYNVMRHMLHNNVGLILTRQLSLPTFQHVLVTKFPIDGNTISLQTREYNYLFPIYLYPETEAATLFDASAFSPWAPDPAHGNRVPNLAPEFVKAAEAALGLPFAPIQAAAHDPATFGPEDLLAYIYAIFHSPAYRERYAEFLKIDFPRVPLTTDAALFWQLVALGRELIALHLLESPKVGQSVTRYPAPGNNEVAPKGGYPQYTPPNPEQGSGGRVYINKEQYFEGVPEDVWEFQIGGYQVCDKWLKDRRGRLLTFDDLMHYQKVVVALQETLRLMGEIDAAIPAWPLQ